MLHFSTYLTFLLIPPGSSRCRRRRLSISDKGENRGTGVTIDRVPAIGWVGKPDEFKPFGSLVAYVRTTNFFNLIFVSFSDIKCQFQLLNIQDVKFSDSIHKMSVSGAVASVFGGERGTLRGGSCCSRSGFYPDENVSAWAGHWVLGTGNWALGSHFQDKQIREEEFVCHENGFPVPT